MKTKERAAREWVKNAYEPPLSDEEINTYEQFEIDTFQAGVEWAAKEIKEELQCYSTGISVLNECGTKKLFKELIGEDEDEE